LKSTRPQKDQPSHLINHIRQGQTLRSSGTSLGYYPNGYKDEIVAPQNCYTRAM